MKLQFDRVMVEVKVEQLFIDQIEFVNQCDMKEVVDNVYEWKHVSCMSCMRMGHTEDQCKKPVRRTEWRPKVVTLSEKVAVLKVATLLEPRHCC